jgi:translation initiation factor 3 subunit M
MPNTLLIEGTFEELVDELASYVDNLKKAQGDEGSDVQGDCAKLVQQGNKDEVLKKLVGASSILNSAPEKGLRFCFHA